MNNIRKVEHKVIYAIRNKKDDIVSKSLTVRTPRGPHSSEFVEFAITRCQSLTWGNGNANIML